MKVFLANPPCRISLSRDLEKYFVRAGSRWPFSVVKKIKDKPDYIPFPFYLSYSAALLLKDGHEVIVDDGVAINETESQFLEKIYDEKPELLLFETSTPTINYDISLVKKIKKQLRGLIVCLAGTHATTFFREILDKNKEVDYILLAEYELSLQKLVKALERDEKPELGVAYKYKGKILSNNPELIDPLDQLPFPARNLFPNNKNPDPTVYWDGFCQYKPAIQMHASRGCPFRCNFCLWNQVMYRNSKYRFFSAKRVVDEMEEVVKGYNAREIYFDDDTFTADKKQVLLICKEITRRGLCVNWSVMGDAMITDREMIEAMADAGCIGMKFGVESGSSEILKHIEKPVNFSKLRSFTDWCAKKKIKTHSTFTFGLSGETEETMEETLNLAKSLDVDSVQFSITTPFPGTRYFKEVKKDGLLLTDNWEDFDGASQSVVRFKDLSSDIVKNYWQEASGKWLRYKFFKPSWVIRQFYYFKRMIEGQGLKVIWTKTSRLVNLLLS